MSERLPDDDNTLEDGPELLRQARAGAAPPSGRPDDDTLPADPHRLTEADLADAPSQGLPDDDTIDADPELLRQVVAASAARGAHDGDETVVRDPESLREAQAVTAASHAAPQESRRRRWLVALAIPIVLVIALVALAAFDGWFGNGPGGDPEDTTEAASSSTPSDGDESAEAGGSGTPISDETTDPPETEPPPENEAIVDEKEEEGPNGDTPDNSAESAEAGDSDTPNSDETTDPPETEPPPENEAIVDEEKEEGPNGGTPGDGDESAEAGGSGTPPPKQPAIDATGGENRASANWSADDNGSPISEWEINDDNMPDGPGRTATSHTWTNVAAGTYTITVKARNAGGWSQPATTNVTVAQTPPDTPTIDATGGENRASANWSADDNGSPISEWEINDDNMPDGPGRTATSHTWTNVAAGTYTITVKARNAGGWSPLAAATVQVTNPDPRAPGKPAISADGGQNSATAKWSAHNNGSTILQWKIDDGGMPGGPGRTATSHTWTNVAAGTYTITVKARNAGGWSLPATLTVTVAQSPPEAPRVEATKESNGITYSATATNNGSEIDTWEQELLELATRERFAERQRFDVDQNAPGWENVPPGRYVVRIRARNAGGWGDWGESGPIIVEDPRRTIVNDDPFLGDRVEPYSWWIPNDPGVLDTGYDSDFHFTLTIGNTADDAYDSWASWTFGSVEAGRYELEVWIPARWATAHVEYLVWIDGDFERGRWLDQQKFEGWQSLGEYDVGTSVSVEIRDSRARDDYNDEGTAQTRLAADAMRLRPR